MLESEYLARRQRNAAYSLRAFAKFLDLPSGRLSQLLSKKRRFTPKIGKKIASRLNFDPWKTEQLLRSIEALRKGSSLAPTVPYSPIAMDQFQTIADPVHFSVLSLLELDNFQGKPTAVAEKLAISVVEARGVLARLQRVGLVQIDKSGAYSLTAQEARATTTDISFAALRECHKRLLRDSIDLIDTVPIELRDVTSITMAIDSKKLAEAKKKIRDFRRSMAEFLESGKKKEVYRMNIQLLPVTKKKERK